MRLEVVFMGDVDLNVFNGYQVTVNGNTITCGDDAWEVLHIVDTVPGDKSIRFERGGNDE